MTQRVRLWAKRAFATARLGGTRRTSRFMKMSPRAVERPDGGVSRVFTNPTERHAAYDLLELDAADVLDAFSAGSARMCAGEKKVTVVLDGTSLSLVDNKREKDFGGVGT